jgi:hypothetical protein
MTRAGARRSCQGLLAGVLLWATVVSLTGGFVIDTEALQISSRNPVNAWLAAAAVACAVWVLGWPDPRRALRADAAWWMQAAGHGLQTLRAHRTWAPAFLAAVGSAVLLIAHWGRARPLWLDEQMIALNLRERTLGELGGALWLGQAAPFGWLAIQRSVFVVVGDGEAALRLLPVLSAISTLGVGWWAARRWMGPIGAAALMLLLGLGEWVSHYALELKPYSADVLWGLWLPVMAAWVVHADAATLGRRQAAWWALAATAHWISYGALLVTPGSAAIAAAYLWRTHGRHAVRRFVVTGSVWFASLGLHYVVSLRHTLGNSYLDGYWSFAMAPPGAGPGEIVAWLGSALEPLALKPGGTEWWAVLWLAAAGGFVAAGRQALGPILACVPLAAFSLAALRLVPLFERLSLWVVPALYVGVALAIDRGVPLAGRLAREGRRLSGAATLAAVTAAVLMCADLVQRGSAAAGYRPAQSNHRLNDRAGVEWLMLQQRPGDAILTTRLALPAIWWYGEVPLGGSAAGGRTSSGTPILEVAYRPGGADCDSGRLAEALRGHRRTLVYLGFRFDDVPDGFDRLLLERLGEIGSLRAAESFAEAGHVVVFDLGEPMPRGWTLPVTDVTTTPQPVGPGGCLAVSIARRW